MVTSFSHTLRQSAGLIALIGMLALTGCVSVTSYDDDDGYYRCRNGHCYYHDR